MTKELKLTLILLQPSWLSFCTTTIATFAIIAAINWPYLVAMPELFDAFYGKLGIITVIERSASSLQDIENAIKSSPLFYGALLAVLALTAGTVAYLIVHSLRRGVVTVWSARTDSESMRHERLQRFLTRALILAIWIAYLLFTIYIAAPFCLLLWRINIESTGGLTGIATSIPATLLLFATLHMHIIFARLFFLRPRVFGGEATAELAFIDEK